MTEACKIRRLARRAEARARGITLAEMRANEEMLAREEARRVAAFAKRKSEERFALLNRAKRAGSGKRRRMLATLIKAS